MYHHVDLLFRNVARLFFMEISKRDRILLRLLEDKRRSSSNSISSIKIPLDFCLVIFGSFFTGIVIFLSFLK
ncbi:MAG: hypothetical protein C4617_03170 [Candidatus Liberibacter europaeus]|uniref:Uncharacterized protein n=1 Tax=Candidatus Liberibacter europaeus TaxID=744859 RepID=A0A2T4VYG1_9HYPH|nr:hypothetical protein [Candidatus Liberibacter europaeus]PTL86814.1 MAG: hypothetical protein C4617_03170 [Candidatus Liberibacter europaeus]